MRHSCDVSSDGAFRRRWRRWERPRREWAVTCGIVVRCAPCDMAMAPMRADVPRACGRAVDSTRVRGRSDAGGVLSRKMVDLRFLGRAEPRPLFVGALTVRLVSWSWTARSCARSARAARLRARSPAPPHRRRYSARVATTGSTRGRRRAKRPGATASARSTSRASRRSASSPRSRPGTGCGTHPSNADSYTRCDSRVYHAREQGNPVAAPPGTHPQLIQLHIRRAST